MIVAFDDIDDPTSVQIVDPDNFEVVLGDGYSLVGMKIEVTEQSVTEGVVERPLHWLATVGRERYGLKEPPSVGLVSDQPNPQEYLISPSDFSTELYK